MALRPLNLSELSIAIKNTIECPFITPVEVIREYVSGDCRNILVIKTDEFDVTDEKDKVGLIHQSAKDYLLRKTPDLDPELEAFRVKEEIANLEIARKCLDCLESGALENRECVPERLLRNPGHLRDFLLLSYAVLHWHEHARFVARLEDIFDLSLPFYHEKSKVRTSWLKAYGAHTHVFDAIFRGRNRGPPKSFNLLHLASCFGIRPLAENIVFMKSGINEKERLEYLNEFDGEGKTALMWAAKCGHEAVVRLLLEKGADIAVRQEDQWRTALIPAAEAGYEAIVRLLLEKGANIKAIDSYGTTALIVAVRYGREAVVKLLLEKGADINATSQNGQTALIRAAIFGHKAVVQLLLEKGADINATDKDGETALMSAASYGPEAVVQLLLEKGADIDTKDKDGETALISAASSGDEAVVQLLLEKGANIHAISENGGTALMSAAKSGDKDVVQLLLEKGGNIEARNNLGETALMKAAECRYPRWSVAVIRLLLKKGADIWAQDKTRATALKKVVKRKKRCLPSEKSEYEAVIRLLTPNRSS